MKCGFCAYTDGPGYSSVKCKITGEFHKYGEDCTAFPTAPIITTEPATESHCLICGEDVPASGAEFSIVVCEKCKEAVMKVREEIEKERESAVYRIKCEMQNEQYRKAIMDALSVPGDIVYRR